MARRSKAFTKRELTKALQAWKAGLSPKEILAILGRVTGSETQLLAHMRREVERKNQCQMTTQKTTSQ